jgi:hypothetical protein
MSIPNDSALRPPGPPPTARIDSKAPKSTTRLGDALIRISDMVYFIHCDGDSLWTWSLRRRDGSVVATAGRSFVNRSDCMDSVMLTKTSQHAAVVEDDGRGTPC